MVRRVVARLSGIIHVESLEFHPTHRKQPINVSYVDEEEEGMGEEEEEERIRRMLRGSTLKGLASERDQGDLSKDMP